MRREVFWPGVRTTKWMVVAQMAPLLLEQGAVEPLLKSVRAETSGRWDIVRNSLVSRAAIVPPFFYRAWLELHEDSPANDFERVVRGRGVSIATGGSFSPGSGGFSSGAELEWALLLIIRASIPNRILCTTSASKEIMMPDPRLRHTMDSPRSTTHIGSVPGFLLADQTLHIGSVREADCYDLRKEGLQPAKARVVPAYPYAKEQFHLAAFAGFELVSAATFLLEDRTDDGTYSAAGFSWRLRGMATHPRHRNSGYATAVLEHGVRLLRRRQASVLWANGRSSAIGFYLEHGFVCVGDEQVRPGVQPHYRIERRL
ncbi:GNAT family N-acetyltransferase [Bradyrhizobium mercantei]|uniref:GNAT family N-acetyltransferase n=1 Tax=Bradyrhizobium mercantei TaxID=1904807 RepID=UPI00097817E6|nr:GNAT family N-acetyltransferase [Bradyrhizobium mercantei]